MLVMKYDRYMGIKLDRIDFFIPLPHAMPMGDGTKIVLTEQDDGEAPDTIRFVDADGVSLRYRSQMIFHQVNISRDQVLLNASSQAFSRFKEIPKKDKEEVNGPNNEYVTVIQFATVTKRKTHSEQDLSNFFDNAISGIRNYQKAYHLASTDMIKLITRQNASELIMMSMSELNSNSDIESRTATTSGDSIMFTHLPSSSSMLGDELHEADIQHILYASNYLDNALDQFSNVRREAYIAFNEGNSLVACLLFSMSSEILLDELLFALLWEEGYSPQQALELFDADETSTIFQRLSADLYQSRLKGNWSLQDPGVIRNWRNRLLNLRNKVAHMGYEPSEKEMMNAIGAQDELVTFITDRVIDNYKKYPLVCELLAGGDSFKKRGKAEEFDEYLLGLFRAKDPQVKFGNWKRMIEDIRSRSPKVGRYNKSYLSYFIHPSRKTCWVLIDEDRRLFKKIPNQSYGDQKKDSQLQANFKDILDRRGIESGCVIRVTGIKPRYSKDTDDWNPIHEISDIKAISPYPVSYLFPT